jgi:hypothetical protein
MASFIDPRPSGGDLGRSADYFDAILSLIPAKIYFGPGDDEKEHFPSKYAKVRRRAGRSGAASGTLRAPGQFLIFLPPLSSRSPPDTRRT